jgi:hypothetical protein
VKQTPALRALTFLGSTLLLLAIFEACSNDDSTLTVDGPPSISITKITVGPGTDAGQACGNPIGLTLDINNWLLKQPGLCLSAPQCGQVRVTLTRGSDGSVLATRVAVSAAVDLTALGSLETGSYNVEAELIDDSGNVFAITDAGSSSAQETFQVNPAVDCPSSSTGGAPGAGGSPPSDAGAGGFGAAAPDSDTAGSVGVIAGAGGA